VVVTSDRGLCGGFNNNVGRAVAAWMEDIRPRCGGIMLSFCGRRGYLFFRQADARLRVHYEGLSARPAYCAVRRMSLDLQAAFTSGLADEVYLAYTAARGAAQAPAVERLLPLAPLAPPAGAMEPEGSLIEPSLPGLLDTLLGKLATARVHEALTGSAVSEHRARMLAMDSSTTSADNLIETYTLLRNRARQAAITRELSEIVAGAEALA
jgi:F-type H+-transporting ATPase subunit gamma